MGIRLLQTFMTNTVPNGYNDVSIIEECRKYKREHNGEKPILVFDLLGTLSILNRNIVEMLYGGRHWYYAKVMDNLFKQLSEVSTLVFFEDGPLVQQKYDTWIQRQNDKFQKTIRVFDMVHQGVTISRIVENMGKLGKYSIPTVTNHLELIAVTAKKYGTVIVTVTKECDAELARFASNNPAVIAVLADDTDFLIFPGHWRYWSLSQLNKQTLLTKEYSRTAVRQYLNLNDEQMIVLSTIAGNDIIKYDEVRWNHKQFGIRDRKFLGIAQFIRRHIDITNFNGTVLQLANFLLRDTSEGAKRRICESFEQYNINFNPVDDSDSLLLIYCRNKGLNFVYSVLQKRQKTFSLVYWDFRRSDFPDMFRATLKLFRPQIGIIMYHQRRPNEELRYEVYAKRNMFKENQKHFVDPVYPPSEIIVPPLLELLDHDQHPELDPVRYALMKWTISEKLKAIDLTAIPVNYLRSVLTLYFIVQEKFISVKEADFILLTIKQAEMKIIPEALEYPPVVDERAFIISFLFSKIYQFIGRSIKIVGLSHLNSLLNFDGVYFHKTYLQFKTSEPAPLLSDIKNYRIYATIK